MTTTYPALVLSRDSPALDDAGLIAAFREGNLNAPARLFDRYGKHVERLLIRTLGADSEIEDLMHDTFLASFRSIHGLRDPGALKGWLTRLTVNQACSFLRARRRRRWLVYLPHEDVPELSYDPHDERNSLGARVQLALASIRSPNERIAFTLRVLEGMTLKETADACGCSLATAKRRVARGKRSFVKAASRDTVLAQRYQTERDDES